MTLAERLGKTLDEIGEIPAREITEWLAYDRLKQDPHAGENVEDILLRGFSGPR